MRFPLLAGALGLALAAPAAALDITIVYDDTIPNAVDPCEPGMNWPACAGGDDRTAEAQALLQQAADHWARIIEDDQAVTVRWRWVSGEKPFANAVADGNGKPVSGTMGFTVEFDYYYDPDPDRHDDDHRNPRRLVPRLYRDVLPEEQAEAIDGAPPGVLEVAFNGRRIPSLQLRPDLFTIALHELGHILGFLPEFTGFDPECQPPDDVFFDLDPAWVVGADVGVKAFEQFTPSKIDCNHVAQGGIVACEQLGLPLDEEQVCKAHQALMFPAVLPRFSARPATAEILAMQTAARWQSIDLPRKFAVGTDDWHEPSLWIGARVPDAQSDVYLLDQPFQRVTGLAFALANDVYIGEGNELSLVFGGLFRDVYVDDGSFVCDLGSTCFTRRVEVGVDGLLDVPFGSEVSAQQIELTSSPSAKGFLRGAGTVSVTALDSGGRIAAQNGTLRFETSNIDPAFDLDDARSQLEAVLGDVVFDGDVADPVRGTIRVGSGRSLVIGSGFRFRGSPFDPAMFLEGRPNPATINGATRLDIALVEVEGRARFTSSLTVLSSLATFLMELGGLQPGEEHDRIDVLGQLSLRGVLEIALENGFQPEEGDAFTIITAGSVVGTFDDVVGTDLGGGLELDVVYNPGSVLLVVNLLGDFDGNGSLGLGDVVTLISSFGACPAGGACDADLNDDGVVGIADLIVWILLFFGFPV